MVSELIIQSQCECNKHPLRPLRSLRAKRKTLGFSRLARAQRLANSVISVLYEKKHCVRETVSSVKSVDQEKAPSGRPTRAQLCVSVHSVSSVDKRNTIVLVDCNPSLATSGKAEVTDFLIPHHKALQVHSKRLVSYCPRRYRILTSKSS